MLILEIYLKFQIKLIVKDPEAMKKMEKKLAPFISRQARI